MNRNIQISKHTNTIAMKRKLLTAGMLALSFSATAQDLTYVGDASKFYVETGTLVYSGGNWVLDSNIEKTIENKGNIMIVGDYKKGTKANAASDGKEFVNVWKDENNYGQVQILSSTSATNALMTMQRPAAPTTYFGGSFPISFPFKDQVNYLMTAFGQATTSFKGSCGIDVNCGMRYAMTLHKWNNNKIQGDAVVANSNFTAGDYYFLNLRPEGDLQPYMTGVISYKGTPAPQAYTSTGIASVIPSMDESSFSNLGYNDWKEKINPYNEKYKTYMGDISTTNKYTGKNIYRFGNPYTSNLDISAVDGTNAWLKITNGGGSRTLKQATTDQLIKDFYITKRTSAYDVFWNPTTGASNVKADYYSAKFDGTNWVGNPEALIIKPLETFNLNFPLLNPTSLGSRIVHLDVNFTDFHKTFKYPAVGTSTTVTAPKNAMMVAKKTSVVGRSAQTLSASTVDRGIVNNDGFYQAEVFLLKNNSVEAAPVYLVGTNYTDISAVAAQSTNKVFLYGMKADGTAEPTSQKLFSEFNSNTYIGRPLSIGFKDLVVGENYQFRFNLYEGSIFTNVKDLTSGAFYIKDNKNNTVKQISADQSYNFTADSNAMAGRFDFYWKEVSGGTLATANSNTKGVTVIYKDGETRKVRFESIAPKANIQVYNMAGRLVDSVDNVSTSQDYTLRLSLNGVYLVRVSYANGEVRTVKTIY